MFRIESLTKNYIKHGASALDNVSFEVNDGEIVGFVGLTGAWFSKNNVLSHWSPFHRRKA